MTRTSKLRRNSDNKIFVPVFVRYTWSDIVDLDRSETDQVKQLNGNLYVSDKGHVYTLLGEDS